MQDYLATFIETNGLAFPDTLAKNATSPGATDGTEFVKALIDDHWGARQALMAAAGLTPDGLTEAPGTSQFVQALKLLLGADKIQPIAASVAANALTLQLEPTILDFRSASLSSGQVNTRLISSTLSLVAPSGATLGTTSGAESRLILLAIDNAGTIELAVVNLIGENNLDETTLISTTAMSVAADLPGVIYSAVARANVPFRVVGFVDSNQAVAGTWATSPSTIQGNGGQALTELQAIGYGQVWQDLFASRSAGIVYTNTSGKPILVNVATQQNSGNTSLTVDGVLVAQTLENEAAFASISTMTAIVPDGGTYIVNLFGSSTVNSWAELR